jgi:hypothetical protein
LGRSEAQAPLTVSPLDLPAILVTVWSVGEFEITRRVREICLALPEVTERPSHGAPSFFVGRQFVMLWPAGHHGVVRPHL